MLEMPFSFEDSGGMILGAMCGAGLLPFELAGACIDVVDVADGVIGKSRIQLNLNQERKTTAAAEAALNWSRNFLRQLIVRVSGNVAKRFKCSVFL